MWRRTLLSSLVVTTAACTYDFDRYEPRARSTIASDAAGDCPDPGGKSSGGHCYFSTGSPLSWAAAKSACEAANGAHLVTIGSSAEQAVVEEVAMGGDRWIGMSRPPLSPNEPGQFKWITGEAMSYLKWDSGEPSGAGECGRLKGGSAWGDGSCTDAVLAICERE
jgi:hypothetical protein